MSVFHYKTQEEGLTVEQLLREEWQAGKKTVHQMRMAKSVKGTDGEPIEWRTPLAEGTPLTFEFPDAQSAYVSEKSDGLAVFFEDEHILAALKPAGITTHPDGPGETGTLMNQVMDYVRKNGGNYAEHIHRLDKGTTGVILIAKHPIAKALFDRMIERNDITRKYIAEVDGYLKRPKGTIRLPIGRDRHHPVKRLVSMSGQSALTNFTVIQRTEDSTFVEAELKTGRTHQIRVHLSHIGHPVIGDTLYGGSETNDGEYRLTATELSFIHPFTGKQTTIETPDSKK
ncbi:RluA family pseudouridine synthase [Sporosarcina limicola]|uniref:Pseudouridine synthase n=1 Tax=Sporosarcina limicola TaxID=34101 RepID=A0A927R3C6_9BACL|nr:RluA family pseudouridine synthase [Sporosarcina limicola]MBE1554941.1 23S rRNA pseudouridine1911/1915/1917 synthase [Sporosarcina limicola]